jgi:hypothetical protein
MIKPEMQQKRQMRQKRSPDTCARTLNHNNFQVTQKFQADQSLLRIPILRYNRAHDEEAAAGVVENSEFCKEQEFLSFPSCCAENSRASKFQDFLHIRVSEFVRSFCRPEFQSFEVFETFCRPKFPSSQVLQIFANQSF